MRHAVAFSACRRRAVQKMRDAAPQGARRSCAGEQGGKGKDVRALPVETAARPLCAGFVKMGKNKRFFPPGCFLRGARMI